MKDNLIIAPNFKDLVWYDKDWNEIKPPTTTLRKMKSAKETEPSVPSSIIILGAPGTGKTTLATQFPGAYFLNADNNIDGPIRWLKDNDRSLDFFYDDILHATLEDLKKVSRLSEADLKDFPEEGIATVPRGCRYRYMAYLLNQAVKNEKVETIILDSLTSIVLIVIDEIIRQEPKLHFGDPLSANTLDSILRIQDWGAFGSLVKNLIFQLLGSGKRLVIIGHVHVLEDELTNILQEFISVPGKLSLNIGAWFQEVWILSFKEKLESGKLVRNRILTTQPSNAQGKLGLKSSVGLEAEQVLDIEQLMKKLS